MFIFLSAKPRPSKEARLNKPADDDVAVEPEKTPDLEDTNDDAMLNDPPPQDHDLFTEQVEIDTTSHTDKPPTPAKAADDQDDDIMIAGTGHTTPGNPVAL